MTTMTGKAPAGGLVSHVNGQFYDGGQFVPDHGKSCGRGKHKVTLERFEHLARVAESNGYRLVFEESTGNFRIFYATGNGMVSARSLETLLKMDTVFRVARAD